MFSLPVFFTLIGVALVSFFIYGHVKHQYWAKRGVWSESKLPLLGNLFNLFFYKCRWEQVDKIYKERKHEKMFGFYFLLTPNLLITDLDLVKLVLVKDADSFIDRTTFDNANEKYFRELLLNLKGEKWKALRGIQSPTFSTGKIKGTFPIVNEKCLNLINNCHKKMKQDGCIDMKEYMSKFAMEIIASTAFGIDVDVYSDEESEFLKATKAMLKPRLKVILKFMVQLICPRAFKALGLSLIDEWVYMINSINETIKMRQEAGIWRGDYLDLMLEAFKNYEESEDPKDYKYPTSIETVISGSILFLLAGYDTSGNALSFVVYLLAKHTECQEELRNEMLNIMENDGEINYRNIFEAKYMDGCVSETLRMYSPAHTLERNCTKDYKFPGCDFTIPAGMTVNIPVWSIHYDSEYWEEPRSFKPERFLPENKHKINKYAYLPFGLGPRNCIGMRFALLTLKMALAHLVLNFEFHLKPGFELCLGTAMQTTRADDKGIQVVLKPLDAK